MGTVPDQQGLALVERDDDGVATAFRADVLRGFSQTQKAVPARWLYDDAGSQLFEDITQLPEYYPTRAEMEILNAHGEDFAQLIGKERAVVEFGSGSSVKTPLLLTAIDPAAYVPLDISGEFLRASARELSAKFPSLPVYPVEADFMRRVELPEAIEAMPKLGFFPGSTIGNMIAPSAVDLLRAMRETLGVGAKLLIGMDLIKDPEALVSAYDDAAGVTAQFNLNLVRRINRQLKGDIPVDDLRHEARWNDEHARIEMHLVAARSLQFTVADRAFTMSKGDSLHTENSHKFSRRTSYMLLLAGGWEPQARWLDADKRFSLLLAEAKPPRTAP
ncbi:MAG: L-histidine N(alpha)-methyltransferase [Pseudomonadota bacterium]